MPEVFDLILPEDPLGQLIDPQHTYVVGKILENVPIVVEANGTDLPLTVTTNGQTEFTVFSIPPRSLLLINGVEYYPTLHYTITQVGPNVILTWLNEFQLKTDFNIILRKF